MLITSGLFEPQLEYHSNFGADPARARASISLKEQSDTVLPVMRIVKSGDFRYRECIVQGQLPVRFIDSVWYSSRPY